MDLVVMLAPEGDTRVGVRGRRGGTPRVPGRRRLPSRLAGRRARRRALDDGAPDRDWRPARRRRGDAGGPRTGWTSGPQADAELVAEALDEVAVSCSPHRDLAVNPAKMLAIAMADATPLVWGGSVLAARAARRVAESLPSPVVGRRSPGTPSTCSRSSRRARAARHVR